MNFKNEHSFEKKSSLKGNEANEFQKLLEQKEKKNNPVQSNWSGLCTDLSKEEITGRVSQNRESHALAYGFTEEERLALISLKDVYKEQQVRYICFDFIFTILDHNFIVAEKLSMEDALEGKLLFILGIPTLKPFIDKHQNTVLYDILFFLKDYNYFAYSTIYNNVSILHINNVNKLLAHVASILTIAAYDKINNCSSESLYINCKLPELRPPNCFSYYISNDDANTEAFHIVYDFYFQRKIKPAFDAVVAPPNTNVAQKVLDESHEKVLRARTVKMKDMIDSYTNALQNKLTGLSKRGKDYI